MDDTGDGISETNVPRTDLIFELDLEFDTEGSEIDFSNDSDPDDFEFHVMYNDTEVDIIKDDQSDFCGAFDGAEVRLPKEMCPVSPTSVLTIVLRSSRAGI